MTTKTRAPHLETQVTWAKTEDPHCPWKATMDGDGTYNFKFQNALVDLASLRLNDVIVGLRFYFSAS